MITLALSGCHVNTKTVHKDVRSSSQETNSSSQEESSVSQNEETNFNISEEESEEIEIDEEETQQETISFNEWLDQENHPNEDNILDSLDTMTVTEIVEKVLEDNDIEKNNVAISYQDLNTDDYYQLYETNEIIGASTTKVLRAMAIQDGINAGELSLEDPVPYHSVYFQDGNGLITQEAKSGTASSTYPLEQVIFESLYHSDNTANTMLRYYYDSVFGENAMFQAMSEITNGELTVEHADENLITSSILENYLLTLATDDSYKPIVDIMIEAEEDMFMNKYIQGEMATKYGSLYENLHHIGIYYIDGKPVYTLVILTDTLGYEKADEFMGQLNLQLATLANYRAEQ